MPDLINAELQNLKQQQKILEQQIRDLNNDFIRKSLALLPEIYTASVTLSYLASYKIPRPNTETEQARLHCFDTYKATFYLKDEDGRVLVETSQYRGFNEETFSARLQVEEKPDFGDSRIVKQVLPCLDFFFEALSQYLSGKTQIPFSIFNDSDHLGWSNCKTWDQVCEANPNIAPIIKQMVANVTVKESA
jgi:hypothetical protein